MGKVIWFVCRTDTLLSKWSATTGTREEEEEKSGTCIWATFSSRIGGRGCPTLQLAEWRIRRWSTYVGCMAGELLRDPDGMESWLPDIYPGAEVMNLVSIPCALWPVLYVVLFTTESWATGNWTLFRTSADMWMWVCALSLFPFFIFSFLFCSHKRQIASCPTKPAIDAQGFVTWRTRSTQPPTWREDHEQ